jgi:hypothetical protein
VVDLLQRRPGGIDPLQVVWWERRRWCRHRSSRRRPRPGGSPPTDDAGSNPNSQARGIAIRVATIDRCRARASGWSSGGGMNQWALPAVAVMLLAYGAWGPAEGGKPPLQPPRGRRIGTGQRWSVRSVPSGWPRRTSSAWSTNRPCSTTPRTALRALARAARSPSGDGAVQEVVVALVGDHRKAAGGAAEGRRGDQVEDAAAGRGPGEPDDLHRQGPGGAEAVDQLGGLGDDHHRAGGGDGRGPSRVVEEPAHPLQAQVRQVVADTARLTTACCPRSPACPALPTRPRGRRGGLRLQTRVGASWTPAWNRPMPYNRSRRRTVNGCDRTSCARPTQKPRSLRPCRSSSSRSTSVSV